MISCRYSPPTSSSAHLERRHENCDFFMSFLVLIPKVEFILIQ
jgi:hypothetical protein